MISCSVPNKARTNHQSAPSRLHRAGVTAPARGSSVRAAPAPAHCTASGWVAADPRLGGARTRHNGQMVVSDAEALPSPTAAAAAAAAGASWRSTFNQGNPRVANILRRPSRFSPPGRTFLSVRKKGSPALSSVSETDRSQRPSYMREFLPCAAFPLVSVSVSFVRFAFVLSWVEICGL